MAFVLSTTISVLAVFVFSIAPLVQSDHLDSVLNLPECDRTCWLGLQPGITTRSQAEAMLASQGIDYELEMFTVPGDSFVWSTRDADPLVDQDSDLTVMVEFLEDVVLRIWLLRAEVCATHVVNAYGIPDATVVTEVPSGFVAEMYYFDEGLAFFGTSETAPFLDSVFITQEDFLRRYMDDSKVVDWDSISDTYAGSCTEEKQPSLPTRPQTLSDIKELLENPDSACELPCFWGVRPGHTAEKELVAFLQPVSIGNNAPELNLTFKEEPQGETIFYIGFGVKDQIVFSSFVTITNPSKWLPPETLELPYLLSIMTSIPAVYLSINITTQRTFLTLAYDEGVMADYSFELHAVGNALTEADFQFCPVIEENYDIILRLRDGDIDSLLKEYGIPLYISRNKLWSVERMTGLETEEFVQRITENPDECIELPSYSELLEMGYEF